MRQCLRGIAAAGGVGVGRAAVITPVSPDYSDVPMRTPAEEKMRLNRAIAALNDRIKESAQQLRQQIGTEEAAIAEGHSALLCDANLLQRIKAVIDGGAVAEAAVDTVCSRLSAQLARAEDAALRQRTTDIIDIKYNLLRELHGIMTADFTALPANTVPVVPALLPSVACRLQKETVAAVVAETGASSCHSAILLKAKEIPAVFSVSRATSVIRNGDVLVVNGNSGSVTVMPCHRYG